ncbi:MAG: aspartate-semialdehyde dehydrogenase [Crocinitomicaceae bacterium]|tara:strand:- start:1986 stop:2963 length:978 start_codon:yes stop_codon:yes gene_type:complete
MKLAIVGATGMVGQVMLEVLEEQNFAISEFLPVASKNSVGKTINFKGEAYDLIAIEEALLQKPDIAIFSAGGSVSLEWAPQFAAVGTVVIDNSSAWRMDPLKKLIIPEVNGHILNSDDKIIPNPNCSTIQLVLALKPLHDFYSIKRVVVSTYQSITGTGVKAVRQMENERKGDDGEKSYPYAIDKNCIPQCDVFMENGYTKEEMKLTNETKKILDASIHVTATAVRVPVVGGHSESVNIEFKNDFELIKVRALLQNMSGIEVLDNPNELEYPMPILSQGKDAVFVGRIRRDESQENTLNMWIVADNLRKGAATNAVQIAKLVTSL